jgi:hypothetical protein
VWREAMHTPITGPHLQQRQKADVGVVPVTPVTPVIVLIYL